MDFEYYKIHLKALHEVIRMLGVRLVSLIIPVLSNPSILKSITLHTIPCFTQTKHAS
jgi:hypothetical protein